ncbi:procollagen-lysine,2-oxoglutarate 5-dioxygenase isoform X1 [Leptopilina heterotoma]|uniref:procollagen-lysine,2-oxoglutarate 5-dioxygenase isoform X1 n=1 Tax=Leptopilina heterotoma TaxID=63436 RepID=UPI001CAA237E|nr:procollagen-lysine,2-oxoglutarate 5-dioxygenase isoform X1 [Leptopilina heterotoma]
MKILQFLNFLIIFLHRVKSDDSHSRCNDTSGTNRYVSRNNFLSFCDNEDRGDPRMENWHFMKKKSCSLMTVDTDDVIVFTVATNATDGYKRFIKSSKVYGFNDKVKVLGFGESWKGGDVQRTTGGAQKLNLLKQALDEYKDDTKKIMLFTDGYDVIFLTDLDSIVEKFKDFNARIVFSAEKHCWPDKNLISEYPSIARGLRFLNSGGYIGYVSDIYSLLSNVELKDDDDDQYFYTKVYLDQELREKHKIKLDHKAEIFQNLYAALGDVELMFKGNEAYVQNKEYNTVPMILHGNGLSKIALNYLGNYLANAWSPEKGCIDCWVDTINLEKAKTKAFPVIQIAAFIVKPMPFLEEFLIKIHQQSYPREKLHLFIYNNVPYHKELVEKFISEHGSDYKSIKTIAPEDEINEVDARDLAMDRCLAKKCSGYFSIDAEAHLDNKETLRFLVEQQRGIVAPLIVRKFKAWSNFWGALTDDGYYARSSDYMQIIHNERRGLWNVPFISSCYLINSTIISNKETRPLYTKGDLDPDMSFALNNRLKDVFMYVSNRMDFGHLINPETFKISYTNPDMYQIIDNRIDWEERYLHEDYSKNFDDGVKHQQPCPDVFWFPIVNTRMTTELIEIMEAFGKWSDGSNQDTRLKDGYENVPTRDIHMNQVNYEPHWLFFLNHYVRPLQERVFDGYVHDPPRSLMNFVVRYKPEEQPSLRPHHDSSTYTINIALNRAGIDYEGGGCRFIRYNCSVKDTKPGWMLMHPGRLTHFHEGLTVTKGTRYIMISFVDP